MAECNMLGIHFINYICLQQWVLHINVIICSLVRWRWVDFECVYDVCPFLTCRHQLTWLWRHLSNPSPLNLVPVSIYVDSLLVFRFRTATTRRSCTVVCFSVKYNNRRVGCSHSQPWPIPAGLGTNARWLVGHPQHECTRIWLWPNIWPSHTQPTVSNQWYKLRLYWPTARHRPVATCRWAAQRMTSAWRSTNNYRTFWIACRRWPTAFEAQQQEGARGGSGL